MVFWLFMVEKNVFAYLHHWGTYPNVKRRNPKKLQIMQEQNDLLEALILEFTHYLNLTMVYVCENNTVKYKLDTN